jgi:hypothetical protein
LEVDMDRSIFVFLFGACALVACTPTIDSTGNEAQNALEDGKESGSKTDPGEGDPGKGDPGKGDPGKGDPGKGDPGKGGCDGGGKGGADGGGCVVLTIYGCTKPDYVKELAATWCPKGTELSDIKGGPTCDGDGVDGVSFTCCPLEPPPEVTCFESKIPPNVCADPIGLKLYFASCDAGFSLPSDPCDPTALVECCTSQDPQPPTKK